MGVGFSFADRCGADSGLFSHVVPKGQALAKARELAAAMVANSSLQSLVFCKRALLSAQMDVHPHDSHQLEVVQPVFVFVLFVFALSSVPHAVHVDSAVLLVGRLGGGLPVVSREARAEIPHDGGRFATRRPRPGVQMARSPAVEEQTLKREPFPLDDDRVDGRHKRHRDWPIGRAGRFLRALLVRQKGKLKQESKREGKQDESAKLLALMRCSSASIAWRTSNSCRYSSG